MKKLIWGTLTATALLGPVAAWAEGNIYLGVHVSQYDIDPQYVSIGNGAKAHGLQAIFGGEVSKYAAVETRFGRSLNFDEVPENETEAAKLDSTFGLYAKAQYPIGGMVKPYLIAGLSKYDLDTSDGTDKASETESDLSVGFGCSVLPLKNLQLGLEFMRVSADNNGSLGNKIFSTSASVAYVFDN